MIKRTILKLISVALCLAVIFCFAGCVADNSASLDSNREVAPLSEISDDMYGAVLSVKDNVWVYALGTAENVVCEDDGQHDHSNTLYFRLTGTPIMCPKMWPQTGDVVDLYFDRAGDAHILNAASVPGLSLMLHDGDSLDVASWTFTYVGAEDKWQVTERETPGLTPGDRLRRLDITSEALLGKVSNGGQWMNAMEADWTGISQLAFASGDMTGIYRSTDAGKTWRLMSQGFGAISANCIAMDPSNPKHILATGTSFSSSDTQEAGMYVSFNGGLFWEKKQEMYISDTIDVRYSVTFDPSSYDADLNMCLRAYYSQQYEIPTSADIDQTNHVSKSRLWKTEDGGFTWTQIGATLNGTSAVNGELGQMYLTISDDGVLFGFKIPKDTVATMGADYSPDAGDTGPLVISYDKGVTWTTVSMPSSAKFSWAETTVGQGDNEAIILACSEGFYKANISASGLGSWTKISTGSASENPTWYPVATKSETIGYSSSNKYAKEKCGRHVTHSSLGGYAQYMINSPDGSKISCQASIPYGDDGLSVGYEMYSVDGGSTWDFSDTSALELASGKVYQPRNERRSDRTFLPTSVDADTGTILALDGDSIMRSEDFGKTWQVSNLGLDVPCTEKIEFNVSNPKLVVMPNQDYFGGFSTNAGRSWKNNRWGAAATATTSRTYGGYAIDEKKVVMVYTGIQDDGAPSKKTNLEENWGGRQIWYSTDGLNTTANTGAKILYEADYESLGTMDNSYVFIGNMRASTSNLTSWTSMTTSFGTTVYGVWCIDYNTGKLYGRDNANNIVYSVDNGASWTILASYNDYVSEGQEATDAYHHPLKSMTCDKDGNLYLTVLNWKEIDAVYYLKVNSNGEITELENPFGYSQRTATLLVDYYQPQVIYAASGRKVQWNRDKQKTEVSYDECALMRSVDGGQTWVTLDAHHGSGNSYTVRIGTGDYVNAVINYAKNEVWFVGNCRGIACIDRTII